TAIKNSFRSPSTSLRFGSSASRRFSATSFPRGTMSATIRQRSPKRSSGCTTVMAGVLNECAKRHERPASHHHGRRPWHPHEVEDREGAAPRGGTRADRLRG